MSDHRYVHQCNADLETRAKLLKEGRQLERERLAKTIQRIADDYAVTDSERHLLANLYALMTEGYE